MILLWVAPRQLLRSIDVFRGCIGVRHRAPQRLLTAPYFQESPIRPLFFLFYHPRVEVAHWQRAKHPYYAILLPHGVRLLAPLYLDLPPTRLAYTYHRLWRTCRGCPLWCYPCIKAFMWTCRRSCLHRSNSQNTLTTPAASVTRSTFSSRSGLMTRPHASHLSSFSAS